MSNITSFDDIPTGHCNFHTNVDLFSWDIRLLFLQCNESGVGLAVILIVAGCIKLFQNTLYQKIGQKQRELLQETKERRAKSALLVLVFLEFVAGVIGIVSILVITGNNAIVWIVIILSNCAGTAFAFWRANPDHHSTSKDIMHMLKHYEYLQKQKMEANQKVTPDKKHSCHPSQIFQCFKNCRQEANKKEQGKEPFLQSMDNTELESIASMDNTELESIEKTLRKLNNILKTFSNVPDTSKVNTDPTEEPTSWQHQNQLDRSSLRARLII